MVTIVIFLIASLISESSGALRQTTLFLEEVGADDVDDRGRLVLNEDNWDMGEGANLVRDAGDDAPEIRLQDSWIQTVQPIMISRNWEAEATIRANSKGSVSFTLWCVKDPIKTSAVKNALFEGIAVTIDDGTRAIFYGSNPNDPKPDAGEEAPKRIVLKNSDKEAKECKRIFANLNKGQHFSVKVTAGMGSLEVYVETDATGWVPCLNVEGNSSLEPLWGYHYIAFSVPSLEKKSKDRSYEANLLQLVVTSVEHDYAALDKSEEDLSDISDMNVEELQQLVKEMRRRHRRKIEELHDHLEMQFESMDSHLERMLSEVRRHEADVEARVRRLEQETLGKVSDFTKEHLSKRHAWFGPFLIVVVLLVGLTYVGYSRYNYLIKQHLL